MCLPLNYNSSTPLINVFVFVGYVYRLSATHLPFKFSNEITFCNKKCIIHIFLYTIYLRIVGAKIALIAESGWTVVERDEGWGEGFGVEQVNVRDFVCWCVCVQLWLCVYFPMHFVSCFIYIYICLITSYYVFVLCVSVDFLFSY